jgi:hypothetical protein
MATKGSQEEARILKLLQDQYDYKSLLKISLMVAVKSDQELKNYEIRNRAIAISLYYAMALGWKAGIRIDANEPKWPVTYIELPTGQVSWHLPQHELEYDGHSVEEKNRRIAEFIDGDD